MKSFLNLLENRWKNSKTMLCVGLDTDLKKIPEILLSSQKPIFEFNKQIIDATHQWVCAFKPQIAYYSAQRAESQLQETIDYIKNTYPEIPVILDSKRGDIGDTAEFYAREAFEIYGAHAVTVNPYMGGDTLQPFLKYKDKGVIVLCKTSNAGSGEFQNATLKDGAPLFELVAHKAQTEWNQNKNVSLVMGGTHPRELARVREICPEIPFLVPGVGAQGASVKDIVQAAGQGQKGLMINASRSVIYASSEADFAEKAALAAQKLCEEIRQS